MKHLSLGVNVAHPPPPPPNKILEGNLSVFSAILGMFDHVHMYPITVKLASCLSDFDKKISPGCVVFGHKGNNMGTILEEAAASSASMVATALRVWVPTI